MRADSWAVCRLPNSSGTFHLHKVGRDTRPLCQPLIPSVLRQGRAHLLSTADQFLLSMLILGLRRLSHHGQIGPVSARPSWAIEHHLRRYPAVRYVASCAKWDGGEAEPWLRKREGSWAILLGPTADFQAGEGLQELIWKVKIGLFFSRPEAPKVDVQFESAVSLCFGSWVISFWFCFIYSFILVNTNSLLPAAKSPEPSLLQHLPHPEPWQLLPCLKSLCAQLQENSSGKCQNLNLLGGWPFVIT